MADWPLGPSLLAHFLPVPATQARREGNLERAELAAPLPLLSLLMQRCVWDSTWAFTELKKRQGRRQGGGEAGSRLVRKVIFEKQQSGGLSTEHPW